MASTVDVLSGGRLTLGIAAGEHERGFQAFGYEEVDIPERLQQLREAVQIISSMWVLDQATFEGKHYRVQGAINEPKGVQKPHIPLLIAGDDEQVTLKLVAQHANACLLGPADLTTIARKFAVLKEHCLAEGTDYERIWRTVTVFCAIGETDEQAVASFSDAWKVHFQTTKDALEAFVAKDRSVAALVEGITAILAGDPAGALSLGPIGSPQTIRKCLADYEAIGVQELRLIFPDAVHLESIRRFANEFIS
jgi:alkanesulfonate monooxygenase SsuD/methylene tetrahydromethanopterin reductase-like flavin-dependent oxidoreductase (luciferase family)